MAMTDRCYTIGLDYGSLSCRGVLVDVKDGRIVAVSEFAYPHGIMDEQLPDGTKIPPRFFLQHPGDYVQALEKVVPALVASGKLKPEQVVAIGVDFTACTMIPVDENFVPLSENRAFSGHVHAWTKLWKHAGAQAQAETLTRICTLQNRSYLHWYGGKMQPQSLIAKAIEVFESDPQVYDAARGFVEAADYVTSLLVGKPVFGYSPAAGKAFYSRETGDPDADFFAAIHTALKNLPREKLRLQFTQDAPVDPWKAAGKLCSHWAEKLGLTEQCIVSGPQLDGYAPVPALGVDQPGTMMMIVGTSTAMMLMHTRLTDVPGAMACLEDIFYPGMWCYASGQASVGDGFQWFVDNCVPEKYVKNASDSHMTIQQYLTSLAEKIAPGATGLMALDWYNGNKSCLVNSRLSGMFLGLTLNTRAEDIYRAILEATAFGARMIIEGYEQAGIPVNEIRICGGIAVKNPLLMQIYADVLKRPVKVSLNRQAAALGTAIYAAAAAGPATGYDSIFDAVKGMADRRFKTYLPNSDHEAIYDALFKEYVQLHDYFGRGTNPVMENLRCVMEAAVDEKACQ